MRVLVCSATRQLVFVQVFGSTPSRSEIPLVIHLWNYFKDSDYIDFFFQIKGVERLLRLREFLS